MTSNRKTDFKFAVLFLFGLFEYWKRLFLF